MNVWKENWSDTGMSQRPNGEDILVTQVISFSIEKHYINNTQ